MDQRRGLVLAILVASASLPGCYIHKASHEANRHIVMFDYDGKPVDPTDPVSRWNILQFADYNRYGQKDFCDQLDAIGDSIVESQRSGRTRNVVIFVHGGLNTQTGSVERAEDLYQDILDSGQYPLFVNWRSELTNSYRDHLFYVRQGADVHEGGYLERTLGYLTGPLVFVVDVVRSVVRLPLTISAQVTGTFEWMKASTSRYREAADDTFAELYGDEDYNIHAENLERFDAGWRPDPVNPAWYEVPRWLVFSAPKVASIAIIDTAGTIVKAAQALKDNGAERIIACAVHGVLSGPAVDRITSAPIERLVVTNTIPHDGERARCQKITVLSVARLLGQAIRSIHEETSVSSLFV